MDAVAFVKIKTCNVEIVIITEINDLKLSFNFKTANKATVLHDWAYSAELSLDTWAGTAHTSQYFLITVYYMFITCLCTVP